MQRFADDELYPTISVQQPSRDGASQRVYLGIMADLEDGNMVPGQRLVETELASRFGVGRNAVREAMQRLAVRGVVDLSRHRSAAIRKLSFDETMDVLVVARMMTGLMARTAARRFDRGLHGHELDAVLISLVAAQATRSPGAFSKARRRFYRTLLHIGRNAELERLFPAIGMHIIYSQFRSAHLQEIRIADYAAMADTVKSGDACAAETAAHNHVDHVRDLIVVAMASLVAVRPTWHTAISASSARA